MDLIMFIYKIKNPDKHRDQLLKISSSLLISVGKKSKNMNK